MNIEEVQNYCLKKPAVTEEMPFGPDVLVFKVAGKVFLLCPLDDVEFKINLKCDPDYAEELREKYQEIVPGWHMNKKHWNTVFLIGSLSNQFIKELIDHSYSMVVKSMSKKLRQEFGL